MLLALVVALPAWLAASYAFYPGLTAGMANQLRYADMTQNRNLMACIVYWLKFMQQLRFNQTTRVYGFEDAPASDDLARGQLAYHRGDFVTAVDALNRAAAQHGGSEDVLFWLAMSNLRAAEVDNCLPSRRWSGNEHGAHEQEASAYCVLPVRRFHQQREHGERAAELFERLLERYGPNRLYEWLLNVTWMVLGGFPDRVAPRYRITGDFADAFYGDRRAEMTRKYADLRFVERARELHVDTFNTGRGVAVEDFDADGDLDLVTGGSFERVIYYRNESGRDFVDDTAAVGLSGVTQPFVIIAVDFDNDGWPDVFISRPFGVYALYRNEGGRFRDVTAAVGLVQGLGPDEIAATWIPSWADIDNDGDLDLFLAQWGFRLPFVRGLMARPRSDSRLFVNEGSAFVDRTDAYGLRPVVRDQYFIGSAFGDYDGDGFDDLFLSSPLLNTSVLLRNVRGRRFGRAVLDDRREGGFAAAFLDLNHDGRLDIFQGGFGDARTSTSQAVFGEGRWTHRSGHTTVHVQMPSGTFEDRSQMFDLPMSTMGSSYGDLNNDGCFDFYLGTGNPEGWFILPNLLYMGRAEGNGCTLGLDNVSMLAGFGTLQKGHGVVFFDFDNDGDEDVYSSLGGMWPGDGWPNQLFVNESPKRHWVDLRLRGRQTNRFGVGVRVEVHAVTPAGEPVVRHAVMNNKTGFGSAPYLLHMGLGDASRLDRIVVNWPVSRCRQIYLARIDSINTLDEGACGSAPAKSGQ
jgi:hypothetical protein